MKGLPVRLSKSSLGLFAAAAAPGVGSVGEPNRLLPPACGAAATAVLGLAAAKGLLAEAGGACWGLVADFCSCG